MTEGIFGIIDFQHSIEISWEFVADVERTFRSGRVAFPLLSCVSDHHYILGMKRKNYHRNSFRKFKIVHNNKLQLISLMAGEVHNYDSLVTDCLNREGFRGDLDLFIYLYRLYGYKFAKKLNGLFSLGILDEEKSTFFILNDRFGMANQIYWTTAGGRFYFSSHLKTLLLLSGVKKEIEFEGLNLFLKYSYIPSPWTIFKGIRKLPPGHCLTYKDANVTVKPYWEFSVPEDKNGDFQEAIIKYKGLLKDSICRRLNPNSKNGILLSGGLDSSANVALAAESTDKKLLTFAVGFEDPRFDERPYARIISKHFDTQHYETTVTGYEIEDLPKLIWHLEEPYFEFGLFLTYKGLTAAQQEVDTVIGGEGADQLFGTGGFAGGLPAVIHYLLRKHHLLGIGKQVAKLMNGSYFHDHDNLAFKLHMLWDRVIDFNNWFFYGYNQRELLKLYKDPLRATIPPIFPEHFAVQNFGQATHAISFQELFLQTQINLDLKHYVNENVMVKSGRMADMLGITLRESYLDTEVTDFLTSLDYSHKRSGDLLNHLIGNVKTKYLQIKAMEDLLPNEIMTKPKQGGFVPVMIFLKDAGLRNRIYHNLLNSEAIREYFNIDYLKILFNNYERIQGKEIYWYNYHNSKANLILFLLTFDIWHHFYIEKGPVVASQPNLSDYLSRTS